MSFRTVSRFALLSLTMVPLTGCLFIAPPPQDPGDLTFLWSFEGETDCTAARVDEIDIKVTDDDGNVDREVDRITCAGGGLTIENLTPDNYTLEVDAYDDRGNLLFSGGASGAVAAGDTTDLGTINLTRSGDSALGGVAFFWSFDGEADCATAGVDEVDLELVDVSTNTTVVMVTEDCFGGGLTVSDVAPGDYTLYVDAFAANDDYIYAASADVTVLAGLTADLGVLEFDPLDQIGDMGTLSLDFGFLYPADMAESDCRTAGVYEVDVIFIDGPGGAQVDRATIPCSDTAVGADIMVAPGTVDFYLEAYGEYQTMDVLLYDTADQSATIVADQANNLGLVELGRVESNFTDIRFEHTLPQGEDCASLGLDAMTFTLTRLVDGMELVDDSGDFACTDTFVLRETFVPGSYRVDLAGVGGAGNYIGTATVSADPGMETLANIDIVSN